MGSTYIAQARFVAVDLIQVSVLDCSQVADTLRTQAKVAFEVNLGDTMRLCGTAIVSLGASYVGANNKRIIDVVLRLEEAYEECLASPVLQWLT